MIDADTMRVLAVVITDECEGDGAQLKEMVGEVLGSDVTDCTVKSNDKTDDAVKANYNKLASGIPPIGQPDVGPDPAAVLYADGAYGSRKIITMLSNRNIKANVRANVTSTPKGKGYGDAWGLHVRRQLGGGPEEKVGGFSRDERLENMRYWKSTVQYNKRWPG